MIAVVMSWADLLNWTWRLVMLRETLKKSIASHVHANHLHQMVRLVLLRCVPCDGYPEKNWAHWMKVSPRMHSKSGLPSVCNSRRGLRLEIKYGTPMVESEGS